MLEETPGLMDEIRSRFAHVDACPVQGDRIFFENAGGALTLKSVVERSTEFAAMPDNQGRDNPASHHLAATIRQAKDDTKTLFNAPGGEIFVGESGTELLFRLIRTACVSAKGGTVLGSTLEHPASRSACARWSEILGLPYQLVEHDAQSGTVTAEQYAPHVNSDTKVATILHASPVTGMSVDVAAIAHIIRKASPDCLIIVDGIQHAAHGGIDIASYGVDGYVISPYKMFSRHGYGIAWISDRFAAMPHDMLIGGPERNWEFGTRDTGAYATMSEVVRYFEWLGNEVSSETEPRRQIQAAARAIFEHERALTRFMIDGDEEVDGLEAHPGVTVIGGAHNAHREGLVSFVAEGKPAAEIVSELTARGIRAHIRKADHYSANILAPLGLESCVRVSVCHYNTRAEVAAFLRAMIEILSAAPSDPS